MDETARMHRTNRTAAAIARYAQDRVHAVEVLVDEFGWDRTFLALAACDADEAGPALWAALELLTFPERRTGGEVSPRAWWRDDGPCSSS